MQYCFMGPYRGFGSCGRSVRTIGMVRTSGISAQALISKDCMQALWNCTIPGILQITGHCAAASVVFVRAGNLLICSSLIRSFFSNQMSDCVSNSLRSLKTNERPWANRSGCSEEMINRERIAQVAQDKWATMRDLLRSLRGNERMGDLLKKCWLKNLKSCFTMFYLRFLKKIEKMSKSLISSFLVSDVSESLISLKSNEQCERIAHFALQKWATMSDWLRSLRGNERSWANRSGRLPKMREWVNCSFFWANCSFAHLWLKNERFARKSNERIPSPGICQVFAGDCEV